MARTRTTKTRTTVEVVEATLDDLADDLLELSERYMRWVLYGVLDEVAEDAQRRLKDVFDKDIDGGPVAYTRVQPDSKRSSVAANGARKDKGSDRVSSNSKVQRRQSTYLKYALGGEVGGSEFNRERDPGDVGAAKERNFLPKKGLAKIGLAATAEGNLQKRTLKSLAAAAQRKGRKETAAAQAPDGTKKRKRKASLSNLPIFFGKSGRKDTRGFWLRFERDAEDSDRVPTLLVLALDRSEYQDDVLIEGWNRSAEETMDGLPLIVKRRLGQVLDRMKV